MEGSGRLESKAVAVDFSVDVIRTLAIIFVILVHTSAFPYRFVNAQLTSLDVVNWFSTSTYNALGMLGVPLFVVAFQPAEVT